MEVYRMRKVLHHLSRLEKTSPNPLQGKEANRQDKVEGRFPQKKVAPESGKEGQTGRSHGQPLSQASLGAGKLQVAMQGLRSVCGETHGPGKHVHGGASSRNLQILESTAEEPDKACLPDVGL
eukprot:16429177-Heterocapsa_arctica.AAC.1